MDYHSLKEKAKAWNAQFIHKVIDSKCGLTRTAYHAADYINRPHEDYPLRLPMTLEILMDIPASLKEEGPKRFVQHVHYLLFSDELEVSGIEPGVYRRHTVASEAGNKYPDPIHVPDLMEHFYQDFWHMEPIEMYKVFQSIHPFPDGNGRVGGILLFIRSLMESNKTQVYIPGQ